MLYLKTFAKMKLRRWYIHKRYFFFWIQVKRLISSRIRILNICVILMHSLKPPIIFRKEWVEKPGSTSHETPLNFIFKFDKHLKVKFLQSWCCISIIGFLAPCNGSEDIYSRSQSTDLFPAILAECNGSVTRVSLGFMLSEIMVTEPLHLAIQNYGDMDGTNNASESLNRSLKKYYW